MNTVRGAVATALRAGASRSDSVDPSLTGHLKRSGLCAIALTLGLGGVAHAQDQQSGQKAVLEEITVTGSRIRRTTDFDTPNPTTVVNADYLQNLGIVNIGDAVKSLPANISNNSPTTTGNANFFAGSTIANLRGLNPFFGSRTLNLVNNRRFVPTNQGDGVDLNFIPSILIDRIDVVTGGASAAYGSGAVAGVNNIFLNRRLQGGKMELDFYQTGESDGDDMHIGAAYGSSFANDRAHFVLGFEYQDSDAVGCVEARDWCARGVGFHQNTTAIPGNPTAALLTLGENVRASQLSTTGVIFGSGLQADAAGTGVIPFNRPAGFEGSTPFDVVPGGDGRSIYEYTNLRAPVERKVATGVFTYELTDTVTLTADFSWGEVDTVNLTGALDANFIGISGDNAFVQQSPALAAAVGPFALVNKDWTTQVDSHSVFNTEVKRAALGLDGVFGASSWTWDAYFQYGETDRQQLVADNRHLNRYLMAVDAVFAVPGDPTSEIVCRVTRDGPSAVPALADPRLAEGCVPLNPFGNGPIPQAARDYAFGFLRENLNYKQNVLAANASGDLFKGFGAGPIQAAAGLEYRTEEGENIAAEELDPWVRTDFLIQYGESFAGDVDITEGFVEVNVPVLRDRPGAQLLELNVAARESRYKNQGGFGTTGESRTHDMFTWKISGLYDPTDWLRFRGSRSRDSRAANFRELYYGQIIHAGGTFGYCAGFPNDPCTWNLEGNVDLDPEKADTTTFGIVLSPMDNLQFAADYFRIEISDAIQQAAVQRVLDGCQDGDIQEFCDLIVPDVPGQYDFDPVTGLGVQTVRALSFNGSGYVFKGVDVSASYAMDIGAADTLSFRLLATKMLDQNFQPNPTDPFINIVGQTGTGNSFLADNQPAAELLANLTATWTHGPLNLTGQARYVDDGIMDYRGVLPGDPNFDVDPVPNGGRRLSENRVPSYAVFSLAGSYSFEDIGVLSKLQVFASIDNLFDKEPPFAPGGGPFGPSNMNGGTNPVFYDALGRAFRLGVRTEF